MGQPDPSPLKVIDAAVALYELQQDRYRKLVEHVGESLLRELPRRGIRATVQWRAKGAESLRRKLHKPAFVGDLRDKEYALSRIHDLAAVRICTYGDRDRRRARDVVDELFLVDRDSVVVKDEERSRRTDTSRWYRATHLQLRLRPDRLTDELRNARDDTCEVQLCSLLQHAYNEVEHDIAYKPTVKPPQEVVDLLHRIGEWREAGDRMIDELLARYAAFEAGLLHRSVDTYEGFVADVTDRLPVDPQDRKLPDLHTALVGCGILDAEALWSGVQLDDFYVADERIHTLCVALEQAHRILGPRGYAPLLMDAESTADRLLVTLLPTLAERLSGSHVTRIATICKAHLALTGPDHEP